MADMTTEPAIQTLQSKFEGLNEQVLEGHKILDRIAPRDGEEGADAPSPIGATHSADDCKRNLDQLLIRLRDVANRVGTL